MSKTRTTPRSEHELARNRYPWRTQEKVIIGFFLAIPVVLSVLYFGVHANLGSAYPTVSAMALAAAGFLTYIGYAKKEATELVAVLRDGELMVTGGGKNLDSHNRIRLSEIEHIGYRSDTDTFTLGREDGNPAYVPGRIAAERPLRVILMGLVKSGKVEINKNARAELDLYNELDPIPEAEPNHV